MSIAESRSELFRAQSLVNVDLQHTPPSPYPIPQPIVLIKRIKTNTFTNSDHTSIDNKLQAHHRQRCPYLTKTIHLSPFPNQYH